MTQLSRAVLAVLTTPAVSRLFRPAMRSRATIFMLHRFQAPELGVSEGLNPEILRRGLEMLRRRRFELVSLTEVLRRLSGEGPPPAGAIAFTIDDGYREQALVAAPLFAAYDCPVTTFVTSGFLDRQLWFWWDRIRHVFRQTRKSTVEFELAGAKLRFTWQDTGERDRVEADVIERCKTVPDRDKHAGIARLAAAADVAPPESPPPGYDPMSWDDLRNCESRGMTFGPHTVTHPILSRTTDEVSRHELQESWRRLAEQASRPVKVFCYPNGREGDFGAREIATLRQMAFQGAVVGTRGFAGRYTTTDQDAPYHVRRMEYPENVREVVRFASGIERLNLLLRGFE